MKTDYGYYLKAPGIPEPIPEYKFDGKRRWRVDFCWPDHKLAVEIEGGIWRQGRHTRGSGFVRDAEKYNALAQLGYCLLRFTPQQVRTGEARAIIAQWFGGRG